MKFHLLLLITCTAISTLKIASGLRCYKCENSQSLYPSDCEKISSDKHLLTLNQIRTPRNKTNMKLYCSVRLTESKGMKQIVRSYTVLAGERSENYCEPIKRDYGLEMSCYCREDECNGMNIEALESFRPGSHAAWSSKKRRMGTKSIESVGRERIVKYTDLETGGMFWVSEFRKARVEYDEDEFKDFEMMKPKHKKILNNKLDGNTEASTKTRVTVTPVTTGESTTEKVNKEVTSSTFDSPVSSPQTSSEGNQSDIVGTTAVDGVSFTTTNEQADTSSTTTLSYRTSINPDSTPSITTEKNEVFPTSTYIHSTPSVSSMVTGNENEPSTDLLYTKATEISSETSSKGITTASVQESKQTVSHDTNVQSTPPTGTGHKKDIDSKPTVSEKSSTTPKIPNSEENEVVMSYAPQEKTGFISTTFSSSVKYENSNSTVPKNAEGSTSETISDQETKLEVPTEGQASTESTFKLRTEFNSEPMMTTSYHVNPESISKSSGDQVSQDLTTSGYTNPSNLAETKIPEGHLLPSTSYIIQLIAKLMPAIPEQQTGSPDVPANA